MTVLTPSRISEPLEASVARPAPGKVARQAWKRGEIAALICAAAFIVLLTLPFGLHQNGWREWANYYWFILEQRRFVAAHFFPSYFVQAPSSGYFYPSLLFDGDVLITFAAWMTTVIGSAWAAFMFWAAAAWLACFFGVWWLARQAGLSRLWAIAPAIAIGTAPYTIGDFYGNGAWPEIVVAGFVPLAIAGAVSIIRSQKLCPGAVMALAGSTVIICGTNNPGLILGSAFALLLAVGAAFTFPSTLRRRATVKRTFAALMALAVGAAIDSWYLLPIVAYSRYTTLYNTSVSLMTGKAASPYDRLSVVLRPYPFAPVPSANPNAYFQIPVLLALWGLASLLLFRRLAGPYRRASLAAAATLGVCLVFLTSDPAWRILPAPIQAIQFPFRVHTYAVYATGLIVTLGLVAVRTRARKPKRWLALLLVLIAMSGGQAIWQSLTSVGWPTTSGWVQNTSQVSASAFPYSMQWADQLTGFRFLELGKSLSDPPVRVLFAAPPGGWSLPADSNQDRVEVSGPPGNYRVAADVVWSPLVRVSGDAKILGRDSGGLVILDVHSPTGKPWHATFTAADPPPVLIGRLMTLAGLTLLVSWLIVLTLRRRQRLMISPRPDSAGSAE